MKIANIANHSFLEKHLDSKSTVIDCGSNMGEFSKAIVDKFGSVVHGFEPDPRLYPNLPKLENCTYYQKAISDQAGSLTLNIGEGICSSVHFKESESSEAVTVDTIALADFCPTIGLDKIDLLKMDIEGAELQALGQGQMNWLKNTVSQITVEFHEFLNPDWVPEIKSIMARMVDSGFYVLQFSLTYSDVLFVNKNFISLSSVDLAAISFTKYQRGIFRRLGSMIK